MDSALIVWYNVVRAVGRMRIPANWLDGETRVMADLKSENRGGAVSINIWRRTLIGLESLIRHKWQTGGPWTTRVAELDRLVAAERVRQGLPARDKQGETDETARVR